MDPVSAIGVASGALQFFSFASKVLSKLREIYRNSNGLTDANKSILEQVSLFYSGLESQAQSLEDHKLAWSGLRAAAQSPNRYNNLEHILESCLEACRELRSAIEYLRTAMEGSLTLAAILVAAVKSAWKQKRLGRLYERLCTLKRDLIDEMIIVMFSNHLGEIPFPLQTTRLETRILEIISEAMARLAAGSGLWEGPSALRSDGGPETLARVLAKNMRERAWVQSLFFPELNHREDDISKAEADTFEWIFRAPHENASWSDFQDWLKKGDGTYWIYGKVGSGKSTLMKHVAGHATTKNLLKKWSDGKKLVTAEFFFCGAGVDSQKSREGLLRSLLYKILTACPELVSVVLSESSPLSDESCLGPKFWGLSNLSRVWRSLISQSAMMEVNICLFIDGLDEYMQGLGGARLQDLTEMIRTTSNNANIKLCLSSRRRNAFEADFHDAHQLELQDLTGDDMRRYVTNRLESHRSYWEENKIHYPGWHKSIIETIVRKADGMFLWARLVTASFLDGVTNGEKRKDCMARLERIPEEIEQLFYRMLDDAIKLGDGGPRDYGREESIHQLYLVKHYAQQKGKKMPTLCQLYFTSLGPMDDDNQQEDPVFMRRGEFNEWFSRRDVDVECLKLKRRIQGRFMDLLEVSINPRSTPASAGVVRFLHQTVADLLDKDDIHRTQEKWNSERRFRYSLMRLRIIKLKLHGLEGRVCTREEWFSRVRPTICKFIVLVKAQECAGAHEGLRELLSELQLTVDEVWSTVENVTMGSIHWSAVAHNPLGDAHDRRNQSRSWASTPFGAPLGYSSFGEFLRAAGVKCYHWGNSNDDDDGCTDESTDPVYSTDTDSGSNCENDGNKDDNDVHDDDDDDDNERRYPSEHSMKVGKDSPKSSSDPSDGVTTYGMMEGGDSEYPSSRDSESLSDDTGMSDSEDEVKDRVEVDLPSSSEGVGEEYTESLNGISELGEGEDKWGRFAISPVGSGSEADEDRGAPAEGRKMPPSPDIVVQNNKDQDSGGCVVQ